MKLRLLDDSIRLRLSHSDVVAAEQQGIVEGRTCFPNGSTFTFVLAASSQGSAGASYAENRMVVSLPADEISAWANDDEAVSLRGELKLVSGGHLAWLVEKDFQCLTDRPEEDQSELFTNPNAAHS